MNSFMLMLIGCVLLAAAIFFVVNKHSVPVASTTFVGPTIEDVREIAEIATLRVEIGTVMEMTLNPDGKPGRELARGAVIVKGDGVLSVCASGIEIVDRNHAERKLVLRLPQPTVLSARVDHEGTKIYDLTSSAWFGGDKYKSLLMDQAMLQAQRLIEQRVCTPDRAAQTRQQTEALLQNFARKFGYSIEIEWARKEKASEKIAA